VASLRLVVVLLTGAAGEGLGVFDHGNAVGWGELLDDAQAAPYANVEGNLDFVAG
jgi:hypothetical protein